MGDATSSRSAITTRNGACLLHDDRTLFEFLILEGAQAGLSWNTILNKRENYRAAFDGFDPERVARYDRAQDRERLLRDPGIVRNRLKIASAVAEREGLSRVQEEFGSFDRLHLAIRRTASPRELAGARCEAGCRRSTPNPTP